MGRLRTLPPRDLNGDGRPDLVASAGDGIAVLLGSGPGRFAPAMRIPLEHQPGAIALADLNRDGILDVVTADRKDGALVTLTGKHLGRRHGIVWFGATAATAYVSRSDSKIRVRVPRGTAGGSVKVTVTTLIGRSAPKSFVRL